MFSLVYLVVNIVYKLKVLLFMLCVYMEILCFGWGYFVCVDRGWLWRNDVNE